MNDQAEFWRYVDGIKFSAAVAAIETFSTRDSAPESLSRLFTVIGREMQLLLLSERQFHLFTNPDLRQLHIIDCDGETSYREHTRLVFQYTFDTRDQLAWRLYTFGLDRALRDSSHREIRHDPPEAEFPRALWEVIGSPSMVAVAPFCKGDTPGGYFLFCWYSKVVPDLLSDSAAGGTLREGALSVLDYLHRLVMRLVSNHYPISRDTYVPSFQRRGQRNSCILFADIRNFTSAFEASRLMFPAKPSYPELLAGLTKAYLEAASIIIAEPGIGRIDKFLGDGIMATFGEYVIGSEEGTVACLLGLYASVVMEDAFRRLLVEFRGHDAFKGFLREYNDVVNLRLGIGINYGSVVFDYFGSMTGNGESNLIGGYSEYTAIGDNVNAAQRLEGLAAKPVNQVAVIERDEGRRAKSPNLIAPIVLSRTTFMRVADEALKPLGKGDSMEWQESYRSSFALKGKGGAVDAYEVFPDEVNGDRLIATVMEHAGQHLADKIRRRWINGIFKFDDTIVKRLAHQYFPSGATR